MSLPEPDEELAPVPPTSAFVPLERAPDASSLPFSTQAANAEALSGTETGLLDPWRPMGEASRSEARRLESHVVGRVSIGVMAALVLLLLLAVVHDHFFVDHPPGPAAEPRAFTESVAPVTGAQAAAEEPAPVAAGRSSPEVAAADAPPPKAGGEEEQRTACNEALAALALCTVR